jgi:hypothetical protein
MKIKDIDNILFSPIFTSSLLHHFLSGAKNNKIKLELIYFILPLLYDENLLLKLNNSNSSSNIKTLLNDEIKLKLIDFESKVKNYKVKTNEAIIVLSNKIKLEIDDFVTISKFDSINYNSEKDNILRQYFKGAYYLGSIFSKEDYKSLFYKF